MISFYRCLFLSTLGSCCFDISRNGETRASMRRNFTSKRPVKRERSTATLTSCLFIATLWRMSRETDPERSNEKTKEVRLGAWVSVVVLHFCFDVSMSVEAMRRTR